MTDPKKTAYEVYFEDEEFQSRLTRDLNEDQQRFFIKIAELALDMLTEDRKVTYETISKKIRGKGGMNERMLELKRQYLAV